MRASKIAIGRVKKPIGNMEQQREKKKKKDLVSLIEPKTENEK